MGMRISVLKDDPGHAAFLRAREQGFDYVVDLDGVRVRDCRTADDVTGEVEVPVLDARGMLQVDPINRGDIWHETRRGRVTITRRWKAKQF